MTTKPLTAAIAVALPTALLSITAGCGLRSEGATEAQPPAGESWLTPDQIMRAGITTVLVSEEEVGRQLLLSGRLTFDDQRVTHVFSPVSGRVAKTVAALGQHVRAGDPLAVIESPDLGSAVSDLAKAKADLNAAERDYRRMKELFELHAGAERDFEVAEDRFRQAKAELDRSEKKARLLKAGADEQVTQEYTLRSPIEGEVIARNANPGTEVQGQYSGGAGIELYTVGAGDRLWALADLYEIDFPRVRKGSEVTLRVVAYPERTFAGHVDWISGAVDPISRTTKVRCTVDNRDGALKPEMYATVSIATSGHKALAVPRTALVRVGDQLVVFVEMANAPNGKVRFERRPVQIDDEGTESEVSILHGLSAGDRVVISGAILLVGNA
jgi:cobalt-zinc-cadmium efflux system membrane fusion protein